jgi:hypothetical protein
MTFSIARQPLISRLIPTFRFSFQEPRACLERLQRVLSLTVIASADILHLIPAEIFRVPFQLFTRKCLWNQSSECISHPNLRAFQESSSDLFVQTLRWANIPNLNLTVTTLDPVVQDRSCAQLNKWVQDKQHVHQPGRGSSELSVMQLSHA